MITPTIARKYHRAQKCCPQYFFLRCGNSSDSLLDVSPFIRLMISLGAIVGGQLTIICTWSLLTTPLMIRIPKASQLSRPLSRSRPCTDTSSPIRSDIRSGISFDFYTGTPCCTSFLQHHIVVKPAEAGNLNLICQQCNKIYHSSSLCQEPDFRDKKNTPLGRFFDGFFKISLLRHSRTWSARHPDPSWWRRPNAGRKPVRKRALQF